MKDSMLIRNNVTVVSRGSVVVITISESNPYVLRLLGTSCNTDAELYVSTKSITLSLEKGKRGVVALSVATPDGRFNGRELFEVTWVGENKDKILVNLFKPLSSEVNRSFYMSDNGLDVYSGNNVIYRIPFVFWGDDDYYRVEKNVSDHLRRLSGTTYRIIRDGNAVCRFIAGNGDANMSDIEVAHTEYLMENPDYLKSIVKEVIALRQQIKKVDEELKDKNLECHAKQDEVDDLKAKFDKTVKALLYIKNFSSKTMTMTWWEKLKRVRLAFNPRSVYYVDVDLK